MENYVLKRTATGTSISSQDWEKDQDKTLLKRRKSVDFAHNQLAALEAKYSGRVDLPKAEKTCLNLIQRNIDANEDDSSFVCFSDHYCVTVFEDDFEDQKAPHIVTVVCTTHDLEQTFNIPTNLIAPTSIRPSSKALINSHFLEEALQLFEKLEKEFEDEKGSTICKFTGYSLGAGVASVLAWLWPHSTELITFGCPRVGDREFVFETLDTVKQSLRYVYGQDPVPRLIPRAPAKPPVQQMIMNILAMCTRSRASTNDDDRYRHVGVEIRIWTDALGNHREVMKKSGKQRGDESGEAGPEAYDLEELIADHDIEMYVGVFQETLIEHK